MRLCVPSVVVAVAAFISGPVASFSVDGVARTAPTAVATIQPRTGAPGYSWLRIYFYSSSLGVDDRGAATAGRTDSMRATWSAVLQLTVDKASTVWQIDLSLPGHTCTIAESDRDSTHALQEFQFDGRRLHLTGKGSHVCDLKSLGLPNQTFTWDVVLDVPVVDYVR
jgi:hypothetical protein